MRLMYLCILLFATSLTAQNKQDYIWLLGNEIDFRADSLDGMIFDFNGGRTISKFNLATSMGQNNTSISTPDGRLLMYANGCKIIDSTHQVMSNGDSINAGEFYDRHCFNNRGYPGVTSSIILPDPGSATGYYYLHGTLDFIGDPIEYIGSLHNYYSYIDFSNNPLGEVTIKNQEILRQQLYRIAVTTACMHENGRDWWFILHQEATDWKYIMLIDETGINLVDSLQIGVPIDPNNNGGTQAAYSPDGELFAYYYTEEELSIFDFDRSTGALSNFRLITIEEKERSIAQMAFSPNSRFIYAATFTELWQVDLWDEDVQSSVTLIDTFVDVGDILLAGFGRMQMGPDCRIYLSTGNGVSIMHTIRQPNEKGKACDFRQRDLLLPSSNSRLCIPNFPHYRMNEEDICDPTITSVFGIPIVTDYDVSLYPNPATDHIMIDHERPDQIARLEIVDASGSVVDRQQISTLVDFRVDTSHLPSGLYMVRLYYDDSTVSMHRFVVGR